MGQHREAPPWRLICRSPGAGAGPGAGELPADARLVHDFEQPRALATLVRGKPTLQES
jgi:hypothetical protein